MYSTSLYTQIILLLTSSAAVAADNPGKYLNPRSNVTPGTNSVPPPPAPPSTTPATPCTLSLPGRPVIFKINF